MVENTFMEVTIPRLLPYINIIIYVIIGCAVIGGGIWFIVWMRRRKWKIEIHEMKGDGRLHTVGRDTLVERKLNMGTKTIYWLTRRKIEIIPPPDDCVDRFKGKEEVDYLRVERTYVPLTKHASNNYNDPRIRAILQKKYDEIRDGIRSIKTTLFKHEAVRERYMYIPIKKSLHVPIAFKTIEYDMSIMAANEISHADEFYKSKWEFWQKYGPAIIMALIVIFLIIVIVLTYQYMSGITAKIMSEVRNTGTMLQSIMNNVAGGGAKPPG